MVTERDLRKLDALRAEVKQAGLVPQVFAMPEEIPEGVPPTTVPQACLREVLEGVLRANPVIIAPWVPVALTPGKSAARSGPEGKASAGADLPRLTPVEEVKASSKQDENSSPSQVLDSGLGVLGLRAKSFKRKG